MATTVSKEYAEGEKENKGRGCEGSERDNRDVTSALQTSLTRLISHASCQGDGYFQIRFLMIRAHETLLNGLDSLQAQVAEDHSQDVLNWIGYVAAWAKCVEHHHSIEEKVLFPLFESKGLEVHTELEQHHKLHADLDALSALISSWQTSPASYSPTDLQARLDALAPNFRTHLQEEVAHLGKERLAQHVTSEELKKCIAQLEDEAKKGDPFVEPVFMMCHTPAAHKYWSNMGAFVMMILAALVCISLIAFIRHAGWFMYKVLIPGLSWRYAGYWKYAPEPLNI